MRLFTDGDGNPWDVVVGRESYGTVVALFLPRKGSEPPRQALLSVSSPDEGNRILREMAPEDLMALFQSSAERESYDT